MCQQPSLDIQRITAALMHEPTHSRFTHYSMAGNNDRHRIRAARLANSTWAGIQLRGEIAIMACLSEWYGRHGLPYFCLVVSAVEIEGQVEMKSGIVKIGCELFAYSSSVGMARWLWCSMGREEFYAGQGMPHAADAEYAKGSGEFGLIVHDCLECGDTSPLSQARHVAPTKARSCPRTP